MTADARAAAEAVARACYGRLIALIASRSGDVAGAEDALADAFASALVDWPRSGVPANPEAWLLVAARRRVTDAARRARTASEAASQLRLVVEELEDASGTVSEVPDRRLALMFACAHPAIAPAIRAPLILQTQLGFEAAAIASAFLVSPAAMAQRLARAKAKIRGAGIPFGIPDGPELPARLDAVLSAIYAAYGEGWTDATGTDAHRRNLAGEAIWLARLLAILLPHEPEAQGLLALMLHAEARRSARRGPAGEFVPLTDQDTAQWDAGLIAEAEAALGRASRAGPTGRFQLEAAIQSAHAARRLTGRTDWAAILQLHEGLLALTGSPVVAVNRAAVLIETSGPAQALAALDGLAADARIHAYQPYWAARARALERLGSTAGADLAYERAIGLQSDSAARSYLAARRARLSGP